MLKWCYFIIICCCFTLGCGYIQPEVFEPHGIIQPVNGIRILKIDNERVISLLGDYVVRVTPGKRRLLLAVGQNEKTPVDGTKNPFAKMIVDIEEGMCYYIEPQYRYGMNNIFFGAGFKEIKAWKPLLKKALPISGYQTKTIATPTPETTTKEDSTESPSQSEDHSHNIPTTPDIPSQTQPSNSDAKK